MRQRQDFEQFVTAIVFLLILPLLPLLAEYFKTTALRADTLALCLTFYCFCLAVSTHSLFCFTYCLFMGIVESFKYNGASLQSVFPIYSTWEFYLFLTVFGMHGVERFKRHYRKGEKFLSFN